jgi:hypothetical protein
MGDHSESAFLRIDTTTSEVIPEHAARFEEAEVLTHPVKRRLRVGRRAVAGSAHVNELVARGSRDLPHVQPEAALQNTAIQNDGVCRCIHRPWTLLAGRKLSLSRSATNPDAIAVALHTRPISDDHAAEQLIERLGSAVSDAERAERAP